MFDHLNLTSIRSRPNITYENKMVKNTSALLSTKYGTEFGKLFIQKNIQRLSKIQPKGNSKKYSQRYLINPNRLQKVQQKQHSFNRTLTNPPNIENLALSTKQKQSVNYSTRTYRSNNLTIHLKQLPSLQSKSGFNVSHTKIYTLMDEINYINQETIQLKAKTQETNLQLQKLTNNLDNQAIQNQKTLKLKIKQLQSELHQIILNDHKKTQQLRIQAESLKDKNSQLKTFLESIQTKIQSIQNSLGVTTGHHKHFV